MMENQKKPFVLALITARIGSKGIPRKNLAKLGNKPLIVWTIEAACESQMLARIVVSTDDREIRAVAEQHGAEVPFLRPASLAGDSSAHIDVVTHAVGWLENNESKHCDYVLLLQPTSPFRTAIDIDRSIEIAIEKEADCVVGVSESPAHPYLTKRITDKGELLDFGDVPSGYLARQALPPAYVVNGAIYLIRTEVLLSQNTLFPVRTYAYVMPVERSLDIDTGWDLYLAELIMKDQTDNEQPKN